MIGKFLNQKLDSLYKLVIPDQNIGIRICNINGVKVITRRMLLDGLGWEPPMATTTPTSFENQLNAKIHVLIKQWVVHHSEPPLPLENIIKMLSKGSRYNITHINPLFLESIVRAMLLTSDDNLKRKRKFFLATLYRKGYFKNNDNDAFNVAFQSNNATAFKELLDHKNIIPNHLLLKFKKKFNDIKQPNMYAINLFFRLYPIDYQNKKWSELSSYEKLYWLIFEEREALKLSHHLGLVGRIQLKWQDHSLSEIGVSPKVKELDLEGDEGGNSLLSFKQTLLMFQTSITGIKDSDKHILDKVTETIVNIEPRYEFQFKHKLHDGKDHIYIFPLQDEHQTTGYHTHDGRYYHINMGVGSGDIPGILVYEVPLSKREAVHSCLCGLQYHGSTTSFNQAPVRLALKNIAYISLPKQPSGNCSYESIKGLFCAMLFNEYRKSYSNKESFQKTMDLYRAYSLYDLNDAIAEYCSLSLSPNKELLTKAYDQRVSLIKSQVLDDKNFHLIGSGRKSDSSHYFKPEQSKIYYRCS